MDDWWQRFAHAALHDEPLPKIEHDDPDEVAFYDLIMPGTAAPSRVGFWAQRIREAYGARNLAEAALLGPSSPTLRVTHEEYNEIKRLSEADQLAIARLLAGYGLFPTPTAPIKVVIQGEQRAGHR